MHACGVRKRGTGAQAQAHRHMHRRTGTGTQAQTYSSMPARTHILEPGDDKIVVHGGDVALDRVLLLRILGHHGGVVLVHGLAGVGRVRHNRRVALVAFQLLAAQEATCAEGGREGGKVGKYEKPHLLYLLVRASTCATGTGTAMVRLAQ